MVCQWEPKGEPIQGYRLIEPLGSGGFGEVWKCEAPGGLFKAIKKVFGNLNSLDVDGARAEQELEALQRVKEVRHPFICSMERIEIVGGELVIVMELADRTLHDLAVENQAAGLIGIPRDDLLKYLRDAAEALDYMNEKHNLQHLDVKPRNLFLISDHVKVADFGLVKHLERYSTTGLMGGVTPLYAPPETFNGKISQHSDQYSLAIVYQELLTGQRPYNGKNVRQLAQQHLMAEPELRALPESERPVVARALSKDPAKRFPNCTAFLATLYRARFPTRVDTGAGAKKPYAEPAPDAKLDVWEEPAYRSNGGVKQEAEESVAELEQSQLGMTIPQPETGALRPTLIIGVGGFGRKALMELRCRFLDRFGDLSKLPLLHFLCLEPDPEAVNIAARGAPEVALARNEIHHLPLQPVGNYRKRSLDALSEWLPREKLYAMPRSLQPQGIRALGRLAFADNQQRLAARLKREIQEISNPDTIYQSVTQTGLALRDQTPRIYVIAAAGGGSSGLLPDLGYALKRLMHQLRFPEGRVTALLLGGAPTDPATSKQELANVYATLTELNHFSDPDIAFAAQYGADAQRLVDRGPPFSSVYFLPLAHRSPEALDETLAHLGSYLFHEITTPLGLRLDHMRMEEALQNPGTVYTSMGPVTPLRSFGTYAIWFPRGLLMRAASRQACRRLIQHWLATGEAELNPAILEQVNEFIKQSTTSAELQADALTKKIEELAPPMDLGATPAAALASLLSHLDEQTEEPVAKDDPVNWARQAFTRVEEWAGAAGDGAKEVNEWRKTRLNKALAQGAQKLAEAWDKKIASGLWALMEHPGARLAAAESAVVRLQRYCVSAGEALRENVAQEGLKSAHLWKKVEAATEELATEGGGFRWFGGKSKTKQLRSFMDNLSHFARQRLSEEVALAVRQFFAALASRFAERARELAFCRQRLRSIQEKLESSPLERYDGDNSVGEISPTASPIPSTEAFWEIIRQSATARVVLPNNEEDLEKGAISFLQSLAPEQWVRLDKELYERVLAPRGGLQGAATTSGDVARVLTFPLLEETSSILNQHLPNMDVAQILADEFGLDLEAEALIENRSPNEELSKLIKAYLDRAGPLCPGNNGKGLHNFLLVPASPAGRALGDAVLASVPDIKLVRVPGQSDLMFCSEQSNLSLEDAKRALAPCRSAYEALAGAPTTSPHARFDITDWTPLDP